MFQQDINFSLKTIFRSASKVHQQSVPLRNALLYGPPGTKKNSAEKYVSSVINGILYTFVSGADIVPLGMNDPTEIKKLFTWGNEYKRCAYLILSEFRLALKTCNCDTSNSPVIYGYRGGIQHICDILNIFMLLTGTININVMCILTLSQSHILNEAVLDCMDEIIKLSCPGKDDASEGGWWKIH